MHRGDAAAAARNNPRNIHGVAATRFCGYPWPRHSVSDDPSPRNIHVVAAASPRPVDALFPGDKTPQVLALAWALGGIIGAAGTADFIAAALTRGGLPAWALPASTSLLAYLISFATGSSFGTMGILFPLVGPLAWTLGGGDQKLLTHCFGAVLGGSLFGNALLRRRNRSFPRPTHPPQVFSPIADTTILTQLATKVPLTDHVRTAGPYALLVGGLCLVLGDVGVGLGLFPPVVGLGLIVAAQTAALRVFGKRS